MKIFSYGDIKTLQIDYIKGEVKGSVSLIGEITDEWPGFKFVLEQNNSFDEKDVQMIIEIYKIASRPSHVNRHSMELRHDGIYE